MQQLPPVPGNELVSRDNWLLRTESHRANLTSRGQYITRSVQYLIGISFTRALATHRFLYFSPQLEKITAVCFMY